MNWVVTRREMGIKDSKRFVRFNQLGQVDGFGRTANLGTQFASREAAEHMAGQAINWLDEIEVIGFEPVDPYDAHIAIVRGASL